MTPVRCISKPAPFISNYIDWLCPNHLGYLIIKSFQYTKLSKLNHPLEVKITRFVTTYFRFQLSIRQVQVMILVIILFNY